MCVRTPHMPKPAIFPVSQSSGEILNVVGSNFIMHGLLSFSILIEILSYPWALFAFNDWIIFSSFSLSNVILFNMFSAWQILYFGRVLVFCKGSRCLLLIMLNKLVFSKTLVINLPLTRRGKIIGILCHWRKFGVCTCGFLMT